MKKSTKILLGMYSGAVLTGLFLSMLSDSDDAGNVPGINTSKARSGLDVLKDALQAEIDKESKNGKS